MFARTSLICLAVLSVAACGGREPNTIAEIQPGDDALTCQQIRDAITLNNEAIVNLLPERSGDRTQTALAIGAGIIFLPALFFMDLEAGAANEIEGYQKRNKNLAKRYEIKGCEPALEETELAPEELAEDDAKRASSGPYDDKGGLSTGTQ